MSVELVTGYSGVGSDGNPNRHVSSTDDARRQAGTVGLGNYVFSTAGKLAAQMEDASTLVMQPGDGMINGHHFTCPDTTSFTIPTGVQGKKVSNLAVIRYEVGADSVETCTPLVLTGEPSADEPEDPAYNEGDALAGDSPVDFPLYRVVTDGINAGDPEPLFSVLVPYADFRDSVSQKLWSGTLSKGGTVSVPGVRDYMLYVVSTLGPSLVGVRTGEYIDCFGGTAGHVGAALHVVGDSVQMASGDDSFGSITGIWGIA